MYSEFKFHSPITKQKLSLIKPEDFKIPLSTYDEINAKYKYFSSIHEKKNVFLSENKERTKLIRKENDSPQSVLLQRSSLLRNTSQRYSIKFDNNPLNQPNNEESEIVNMVRQQLEAKKQGNKINPVLKLFSNDLIGAFFQALTIKSIEEMNLMTRGSSMSGKILEFWGISPIKLRFLKNKNEKNQYIIERMSYTIDKMLKNWREKIETQERNYNQNDKEYQNLKNNNEKEIRDRFPWLKLKNKYEHLHKKLKSLIIQKLNDYETQIEILKLFKQREETKKIFGKIPYDEMKVTFQMDVPQNTKLIENFNSPKSYSNQNSKKFLKSRQKNFSLDTRISTTQSIQDTHDIKNKTESFNNYISEAIQKSNTFEGNELIFRFQKLEWDDEFEKKFKTYINQGKKIFFNEMKNSNFNEIGVMYMMQELLKEERINNEIEFYSKKYADGEYLTAEELKFLSDTSELLNSCVDQQYIKKIVNIIDPNIMNYMELNLAENIISKYRRMREIIVSSRNKYIELNNAKLKIKLNEFDKKIEIKNQKIEILKKHKKMIKSINVIDKKLSLKPNNFKIHGSPHYLKPKDIDYFSNQKNSNLIKHKYHPSSKIFYFEKDDKEKKYLKTFENELNQFKIQIKSPQILKKQNNFLKFYSGGPEKSSNLGSLYNIYEGIIRNPTANELFNIMKIQKIIKGIIARRNFKKKIEEYKFLKKSKQVKKEEITAESPIYKKSNQKNFSFGSNQSREQKIINKPPPKTLLLKHRKLLEAAKTNNIYMARNSGFCYYPNDMNVKDKDNNVALFYTAKHNNYDFCSFLIDLGSKVNEQCQNNNTPFHMAFETNSIEIIMLMLENGGDLNSLNCFGQTPLAFANEKTLKKLDLEDGIATIDILAQNNVIFDNNRLLSIDKNKPIIQVEEGCNFKIDHMTETSDLIRINDNNDGHLKIISFPEKKKIEKLIIITSNNSENESFASSCSPCKKEKKKNKNFILNY